MNFGSVKAIIIPEGSVYRILSGSTVLWSKGAPTPVNLYVEDLISEGYATLLTGSGGTYVQILSTCPYSMSQIIDLEEVARNEKQLTSGSNNIIAWDQEKPSGWSDSDIVAIYSSESLNFDPRGGMFWGLGDTAPSASVMFSGGSWVAADMPWGSYQSEGIFAPRWNYDKEAEYTAKGFRNTPSYVEVTISGSYSSVAQVMFTEMRTTDTLVLNLGDVFVCHDVVGMFEANNMTNLIINGPFRWDAIRTCLNMFDGCSNLLSIPYVTAWGRTSSYNTIYPHYDGTRGSANVRRIFNASSLTSIGPVFNMNAVHLSGSSATVDGYAQDATSETIFNCPNLTDVRILNLGNNSWDFSNDSTKTYIPNMDVASIEYLLENIKDETGNNYTVTFSDIHESQISSASIAVAEGRGWNVQFASAPSPGYQLLYLQNGTDTSSDKAREWSIDTGITWRDVFVNSSSLGLTAPGLETVVTYAYSTPPPEGGVFAGCNPRYNQEGGQGSRDMGGFWRIFGHGGQHFCFDCPSEDDRNAISGNMVADTIYTETAKYGYLGTNELRSYLKLEAEGSVVGENYKGGLMYTWSDAALPHKLYLWSDNSQADGDTAPRQGVKIYSFTVWYLENGVRHTKIYEGVPWMDSNNVPCIKDLVSGQLQYNCATGGATFDYGTI